MKHLILLSLPLALCACGGGTDGFGGGITAFADAATDTVVAKAVDGGVGADVQRQNVLSGDVVRQRMSIEFSDDFNTAWVTVDGRRYTLQATTPNPSQPGGTLYMNGSNAFLTMVNGDYEGTVNFGNGNTLIWTGVTGVETRPGALPDETVSYFGNFILNTSEPAVDIGETIGRVGGFEMEVDFVTGDLSGTLEDTTGGFDGSFSGSVSGNGFMTGIAYTDPELSGSLSIDGTFYGDDADDVAGLIEGRVSTGHGSREVVGRFSGTGVILP